MPQTGYAFLKVSPLDNQWEIERQKNRVNHVLEFEVAERLILGSRHRLKESNPLDYIYRALGVAIRPLQPDANSRDRQISNAILQYVYNSAPDHIRVEAILAVSLASDQDKSQWCDANLRPKSNRALLWHGTKTVNLLRSGQRTYYVYVKIVLPRLCQLSLVGMAIYSLLFIEAAHLLRFCCPVKGSMRG